MEQKIIFTSDINNSLREILSEISYDKLFILTDLNTEKECLPLFNPVLSEINYFLITVGAGDDEKNLSSLSFIWDKLSSSGATRRSLLINLGGGMITDMGGFAASAFKRGILFINIPTSLLGAVDAAVGGKTGINFNGLKNEIGVFNSAKAVIISTQFFDSLNDENLLSGYAEMLKHGLLSTDNYYKRLINYDLKSRDFDQLLLLLEESVRIKEHVVTIDPFEKGLRKALNLGHTVGHSFESFAMRNHKPVLHGYAVAWGIICELILSHRQTKFSLQILTETAAFIKEHYGVFNISCKNYEELYELMTHDKKNDEGFINFTLLKDIGDVEINQQSTKENIFIMFDIYRDMMGI